MRSGRSCLLLGLVVLVGIGLTGCMGRTFSEPKAVFTASPTEQVVPFTANFDGSLSYDPNGTITSYVWNFGDGGSGMGPVVAHSFKDDGTYAVQLTVIDEHGKTSSSALTVHALDPLPAAAYSWSPKSQMDDGYIVGASEWITFDGSASTDNGTIVSYDWDFGNGETASGKVVQYRYLWAATYSVTLTVTDDCGGKTTCVDKINVLGGPPCNGDIPAGGSCQ